MKNKDEIRALNQYTRSLKRGLPKTPLTKELFTKFEKNIADHKKRKEDVNER